MNIPAPEISRLHWKSDTPGESVCTACPWRLRWLAEERHAYPKAECKDLRMDRRACDDVCYPCTSSSIPDQPLPAGHPYLEHMAAMDAAKEHG